jgi:DUF971 family protein
VARPIDIAYSIKKNALLVTWEDGQIDTFEVPYLRGWCPCASCQGHGSVAAYHEAPEGIRIEGMGEVGAYALGIRFSDGHDSGIYTWTWLAKISERAEPAGPKHGAFEGGVYRPSGADSAPENPA